MKTNKEEVNLRMEKIMKNWRKTKNSINERYFEIWGKPIKGKSFISA